MVADDTVAVLAEVSDSKSIGLARIHTCQGRRTIGEDDESQVHATMGSQGRAGRRCGTCVSSLEVRDHEITTGAAMRSQCASTYDGDVAQKGERVRAPRGGGRASRERPRAVRRWEGVIS